MSTLAIIFARCWNRCIGNNGQLPWHLPDEFEHFNQTTLGHAVIMGRKSYQDHNSLLAGRLNIVVSRNPDFETVPGVQLCDGLESAIQMAQAENRMIFVIGGAGLITEVFGRAELVYETVIEANIQGDTLLPELDFSGWTRHQLLHHLADRDHAYAFTVNRWSRTALSG